MRRSFRGFATTTSCPSPANSRLIQGEWVPTSRTIRARSRPSNRLRSASSWVRTFPRSMTSPSRSSAQISQ